MTVTATTAAAGRHHTTIHPFRALDGVPLTLVHVEKEEGTDAPHGGVPCSSCTARECVRSCSARRWNARSSTRSWTRAGTCGCSTGVPPSTFDPLSWTLDDAAAYDHPAAVREVCRLTGRDRMKAVVHCQGSTSFTISAVSGLCPRSTPSSPTRCPCTR